MTQVGVGPAGRGRSRLVAVILAMTAISAVVIGSFLGRWDGFQDLGLEFWIVAASILGVLIEWKVPGNRMGRILLGTGVVGAIAGVSEAFTSVGSGEVLTTWTAMWSGVGALSYFTFFWASLGLIPLLFPTGHALSHRWALFGWLGAGALIVGAPAALVPSQICVAESGNGCDRLVENPVGISWMPNLEHSDWGLILLVGLLVSLFGGVISLFVRFVRSRGLERQQIKWLLVVFLVTVMWLVLEDIIWVELLDQEESVFFSTVLDAITWASIPVAIALAILRYRLYDIDRIISRTVTYALVGGGLALLVAGVAAVVGTRFDEPLVVAGTTLAVAALFNPLRRRVQSWVDRRFNRSRFDAGRVIDEFAGSLRDEVDPGEVIDGWVEVVEETMQPSAVGVWVRP